MNGSSDREACAFTFFFFANKKVTKKKLAAV
jgi:hypothetical protein